MSRPDPIILIISLLLAGFYTCAADAADGIEVFFNQPDSSASPAKSEIANPDKGIDEALVDFIQTAKSGDKVYLCFYNSTTEKVTDAINAAAVKVGDSNIFHIMEEANGTNGNDTVDDPGLYAFSNSIDDGSDGYPLMHNKFAVVINAAAKTGRVWTGSYNPTSNGTDKNNNNAVWIESYALAKKYGDEFMFMWNSGGGNFSTAKTNSVNTAKSITAGDVQIDVYFSPYTGKTNTNTSLKLRDLIDNATHSVFFNMFTFTSAETSIKQAVKDAFYRGVEVKGVVEATQSSDVQSQLRRLGIDVVLDANDGNLHHKFCVIDYGTDHAKVVTGSYNWTVSARDTNDENFLVIHSREVAELYWKEFQKNYALAGGSQGDSGQPAVSDVLIYPSPAENTEAVTVGYTLSDSVTEVLITAYTLTGERVIRIEPEFYPGTYNEKTWELVNSSGDGIATGLYIIKVTATTGDGAFFDTDKFAVIR